MYLPWQAGGKRTVLNAHIRSFLYNIHQQPGVFFNNVDFV